MRLHPLLHGAAGVAVATALAIGFQRLGIPLAYILGALVGSALYTNLLGPIRYGKGLRRGAQLVLGAAVGALLTPDTVSELVRLLPIMIAATVGLNVAGALLAFPVARIAGVDRLTALMACLPAGMAEMASLAGDIGAREQPVAVIQTLRVIIVLAVMPLWLGLADAVMPAQVTPTDPLPADPSLLWVLGVVVAASAAFAMCLSRLGVLNPWVITPALMSGALIAVGWSVPPMPPIALIAAQIALGASLGIRFRVDELRSLPRAVVAGVFAALVLIGVSFVALAPLVAAAGGVDWRSAALAVAPGGLGEMIASAKALGLASAAVAGFQFVRSLLTNMFVPQLIKLGMRRGRGVSVPGTDHRSNDAVRGRDGR